RNLTRITKAYFRTITSCPWEKSWTLVLRRRQFEPAGQLLLQILDPLALGRRNRDYVDLGKLFTKRPDIFLRAWQIRFVRNNKPRSFRHQRIIKIELFSQLRQIFNWIASFASGNIDHKQEDFAARDVSQEFV